MTSASWKFMLVLKTKLLTFSAGMEVSSDQIRGAQAHLNWQINCYCIGPALWTDSIYICIGTANLTPLIYSELKTQDFIKSKTKRGCKNATWQCLPLQTSICKIVIRMPQSQCWFYTKVDQLEIKYNHLFSDPFLSPLAALDQQTIYIFAFSDERTQDNEVIFSVAGSGFLLNTFY